MYPGKLNGVLKVLNGASWIENGVLRLLVGVSWILMEF
jgi:hypothetical protein